MHQCLADRPDWPEVFNLQAQGGGLGILFSANEAGGDGRGATGSPFWSHLQDQRKACPFDLDCFRPETGSER